jgi:hypothetical protein
MDKIGKLSVTCLLVASASFVSAELFPLGDVPRQVAVVVFMESAKKRKRVSRGPIL